MHLDTKQRRELKQSGKITNIICHKDLCFLVTPDTVLVHTGIQTLKVEPIVMPGDLWQRRVKLIRDKVLTRRIKCLNDLCAITNTTDGGVRIVRTSMEWYK